MPKSQSTLLHQEMAAHPAVHFLSDVSLSDSIALNKVGFVVVIACSEMGCRLPYLCSDPAADLFTVQNFGHWSREADVAQLSANNLVSDVIVYGHSNCEFTKLLLGEPTNAELDTACMTWLKCKPLIEKKADMSRFFTGDNWPLMNQLSILSELKFLSQSQALARRVSSGRLRLHAWMLNDEKRELQIFQPKLGLFVTV